MATIPLAEFAGGATAFLEAHATRKQAKRKFEWGNGSDPRDATPITGSAKDSVPLRGPDPARTRGSSQELRVLLWTSADRFDPAVHRAVHT